LEKAANLKPALRAVGVLGTGSYVPPRVLTNLDLEKMVDTSDEWITTRSGISERHIAEPEVATSDLAKHSAQIAIERAGLQPTDIGLIVVATVTPDSIFPCTASILQGAIGATGATAFDLVVGCTGFVFALAAAGAMVATGAYQYALVTGAETLSRITDWNDRSTCVLFGDAAGSVVLGPVPEGRGILSYSLGNEAEGQEVLRIPAGGSRLPTSAETVANGDHYLKMVGREVFKFAVRALVDSSEEAVRRAGLTMGDIDLAIPHQANMRIIEAAAKRLDLPADRFFCNVQNYGNTSAATIPLAMDEAVRDGRLVEGNTVLLSSFGAGLSWGSMVLRW
jgi:3-oxoacyl-[acyl-carrier-protein] synthase III